MTPAGPRRGESREPARRVRRTGTVSRAIGYACAASAMVVLAGCAPGADAPVPSRPTPAPQSSTGGPATPAPDPNEVVCVEFVDTESLVRRTAEALEQMPVLPAAIALVLFNTREVASTPGVTDPELAAAQAELVAAIDDLDAQGRELLGPEGDAAQTAVQLDAERILAAITELERLCGD